MVRGVLAIPTLAAARKTSAKRKPKGAETPRFLCSLMLSSLAFGGTLRKPAFVRRLEATAWQTSLRPVEAAVPAGTLENADDTPASTAKTLAASVGPV